MRLHIDAVGDVQLGIRGRENLAHQSMLIGMGRSAIAKALKIGRASVYRALAA
jgi:hypothetical protein